MKSRKLPFDIDVKGRIVISSAATYFIASIICILLLLPMIPMSVLNIYWLYTHPEQLGFLICPALTALIIWKFLRMLKLKDQHFLGYVDFEIAPYTTSLCQGNITFITEPNINRPIVLHLQFRKMKGGDIAHDSPKNYSVSQTIPFASFMKTEEGWKTSFTFIDLPEKSGGDWSLLVQSGGLSSSGTIPQII